MNPLPALMDLRALPRGQRQFLLFAAVVAVALLSMYVQLLHTSLARGNELREVQRTAGVAKPAKAMAPRPAAGLARARNVADSAETRTR